MTANKTTKKKASRRKTKKQTVDSRKTNPLYVVTNNGKDVEQATGAFDALIKRLGLEPAIKMFQSIVEMLLAQVESYPMFVAVKKFIDQIIEALEVFTKKWTPQLHFYR